MTKATGLIFFAAQHTSAFGIQQYVQCILYGLTNILRGWLLWLQNMVVPETIEFSMALLIAETTFKDISKLYL